MTDVNSEINPMDALMANRVIFDKKIINIYPSMSVRHEGGQLYGTLRKFPVTLKHFNGWFHQPLLISAPIFLTLEVVSVSEGIAH